MTQPIPRPSADSQDPIPEGESSPGPPVRSRLRARLLFLAKLAVLSALVAWVVSLVRKDNLLDVVGGISGAYLLAAVLMMGVEWAMHAWKHKVILDRAGAPVPVGRLMWLNLRIFAISLFLPGEVLGGGARLVLMRNLLSVEQCLFLMISDRYTQMAATLIFGVAVCFAVPDSHGMLPVFSLCALGLLAAPALAFHEGLAARSLRILPASWGRKIADALARLKGHFAWNRNTLAVMGLSAALQLEKALFLWLLCFAVGIRVGFPIVVLYLTLIIVVQHVAVSFGGLGVREITSVGFFGLYGVGPEKALVLSLSLYAMHLAKAALGGLAGLAGAGDGAPGRFSRAGIPAAPGRT